MAPVETPAGSVVVACLAGGPPAPLPWRRVSRALSPPRAMPALTEGPNRSCHPTGHATRKSPGTRRKSYPPGHSFAQHEAWPPPRGRCETRDFFMDASSLLIFNFLLYFN